jgi:hypothetical protein
LELLCHLCRQICVIRHILEHNEIQRSEISKLTSDNIYYVN